MQRLWRLLLPDAPMPSCLAPEKQEHKLTLVSDRTAAQDEPRAKAKRRDRDVNKD
jgi:hypothetical protein